MIKRVLIIGNSDGIGLALTKRLLSMGWSVIGLSKSDTQLENRMYRHVIVDVTDEDYLKQLKTIVEDPPDLTIYCAGIGEEFNIELIELEQKVFQVNLMGAVKTIEVILPALILKKSGQIIVLSSLADELISPDAPSYSASKGGLSTYVESVALAVKKYNVSISNIRFGFVETKMAKGEKLPFMMTVEKAVEHILKCIKNKPIRYSRPFILAIIVLFMRWTVRIKLLFS